MKAALLAASLVLLPCTLIAASPDEDSVNAVRQLVALDSAITVGVTADQYSRKVADAHAAIQMAVEMSPFMDPAARLLFTEAIMVHMLASQLLNIPPKSRMMPAPAWLCDVCAFWDKSWGNIPLNNADLQKLWSCTQDKLQKVKPLVLRR